MQSCSDNRLRKWQPELQFITLQYFVWTFRIWTWAVHIMLSIWCSAYFLSFILQYTCSMKSSYGKFNPSPESWSLCPPRALSVVVLLWCWGWYKGSQHRRPTSVSSWAVVGAGCWALHRSQHYTLHYTGHTVTIGTSPEFGIDFVKPCPQTRSTQAPKVQLVQRPT